jgi:hypothetical protein
MKNLETLALENPLLVNERTKVISIGLDMQCRKVITKSILYNEDNQWVVLNGGVHVLCRKIDDIYLDTKENRLELKKLI